MKDNPNILLVVSDAMRPRNMSIYGYHKRTTPYIEELAKEGIVFDNAYSCFNCTDPSFTTIMTGKYPLSHGIIHHGIISGDEVRQYYLRANRNLAQILKSEGYNTMALSWLERWHKEGFDYYAYYGSSGTTRIKRIAKSTLNRLPQGLGTSIKRALVRRVHSTGMVDAQTITNHAINIIKRNQTENTPFFLMIHYMDTHLPYNSPRDYEKRVFEETSDNERVEDILKKIRNPRWRRTLERSLDDAKTTAEVIAKYDSAISYVDDNIRNLIHFLGKRGIKDNTVILLTADHGESLTEHNIYFSHHCLYDELIHVPLVMYYPGCPKGKRVSEFVQHVDIVPTILDILGINAKPPVDGKSLLPLINGEVQQIRTAVLAEEAECYRKKAVRTRRWKYIRTVEGEEPVCNLEYNGIPKDSRICRYCGFSHAENRELYNLENDSQENTNIWQQETEVAQNMEGILKRFEASLRSKAEKERIRKKSKSMSQK